MPSPYCYKLTTLISSYFPFTFTFSNFLSLPPRIIWGSYNWRFFHVSFGYFLHINSIHVQSSFLISVFLCFLEILLIKSISLHLQSQTVSYKNNIKSTATIAVTGTITKITKICTHYYFTQENNKKVLYRGMVPRTMFCLGPNPQCMDRWLNPY